MKREVSVFLALLILFGLFSNLGITVGAADYSSLIDRVEVEDKQIIQNTNGRKVKEYLDAVGDYVEWYEYDFTPSYTVILKDGTKLASDSDGDVRYDGNWHTGRLVTGQSYENQWKIGNNTLTLAVMGVETTFNVEILETPVASIKVDKVELIKNVDSSTYTSYDENGERKDWVGYTVATGFTVTLKDGTSTKVADGSSFKYNGERYYKTITTDQSYENQWDVGTHKATIELLGFETEFEVEVIDSPIKNVELVGDGKLIKNADGYWTSSYDDNDVEVDWYRYSLSNFNVNITFQDDSEIECGIDDGIRYKDRWFYIYTTTDQSLNNQWDIGAHQVNIEVMGYETTLDVEIIQSPIVSVEFDEVKRIENTDGDWTSDYNEDDEYVEWFQYNIIPVCEITLSDGTVVTSDRYGDFKYNNKWYNVECTSDQSYENQWGIGEHKAKLNVLGYETEYTVEVIDTPIESVTIDKLEIVEYSDGYWTSDYNEDDEYVRWFKYYFNPEYTVTLKDGTVLKSDDDGEIKYNGKWYDIDYDTKQSVDNSWGVGTHKVECSVLGFDVTAEVEIVSTPITKIEAIEKDIKLAKEIDGYWEDYYDDYTESWVDYFVYRYTPRFEITFNDGTTVESDRYGDFEYNGNNYSVNISSDQSENKKWGLGKHQFTVEVMNVTTTFDVEIVNSVVKSVEVEPVTIIEKCNVEKVEEYDEEKGEYVYWDKYYISEKYKVTLLDGTILESDSSGEIYYNGRWISLDTDTKQSYENQWGVGTYTVDYSILGYEGQYEVNVVENPIASINIDTLTLIENIDTYWEEDYNEETDEWEEWYKYSLDTKYTVTLKNGTVIHSDSDGDIKYNDTWYYGSFTSNQSYDNPWSIGKYTATLEIMGNETTFDVEIIKTPVVKAEIDKLVLIEKEDGYWEEDYDEDTDDYVEWYKYTLIPNYTVTLNDGTVLESDSDGDVYYNGKYYQFIKNDPQTYENQWSKGKYQVECSVLGYNSTFDVEIVETPIAKIVANPVSVIRHTKGSWEYDYNDNTNKSEDWYEYNLETSYTVTLIDGTVLVSDYDNEIKYNGKWYSLNCESNQSVENPWDVGTYKVTATILGAEVTYDFVITESPVAKISVSDIKVIENHEGYIDYKYDEYTDGYKEYFKYEYRVDYNVTLKDGTVLYANDYGDIYYNGKYYSYKIRDNQSKDNQWKVGEYTATIEVLGKEANIEVEVIPSPVAKVNIPKITVYEYINQETKYSYTDDYEDKIWKKYIYDVSNATVTLKDGTVLKPNEDGDFTYGGKTYYTQVEDDQNYNNQWSVGTHNATVTILGMTTNVSVEVKKCPVTKISAKDVTIYKNINQEWASDGDYYVYVYEPEIAVTYADGSVSTGTEITYNGATYVPEFIDDQSAENVWDVGAHTVTAKIGDVKTTFKVNVVELPIKNITGEVTVYDGITGHTYSDGEFAPNLTHGNVVVTLNDGTIIEEQFNNRMKYPYFELYGNQIALSFKYDGKLKEGKNEITVTAAGKDYKYIVNYLPNPAIKLEVEDTVVYEKVDANSYVPKVKVTLKDGTVLTNNGSNPYVINYNNYKYSISYGDDQDDTHWGLGAHKVKAKVMGLEKEFTVTVKENIVKSVVIKDTKITQNTNGFFDRIGNDYCYKEYYYYDDFNVTDVTVTLTDGTVLKSNEYGQVVFNNKTYMFSEEIDQLMLDTTALGTYTIEGTFMGTETSFKTTITTDKVDKPTTNPTVPSNKTTVTLSKNAVTLYLTGTYKISPVVTNPTGTTTYKSSNTKVATVNAQGVVTAKKNGAATITVTNSGVSKTLKITVKKPTLNKKKITLKKGKKFTLKITGKIGKVKFTTSKKSVAKVSSKGKITAKKPGKAVIKVKTNGITLKCKVTVKKK